MTVRGQEVRIPVYAVGSEIDMFPFSKRVGIQSRTNQLVKSLFLIATIGFLDDTDKSTGDLALSEAIYVLREDLARTCDALSPSRYVVTWLVVTYRSRGFLVKRKYNTQPPVNIRNT